MPQVFISYITPYAGYHPAKGSRRDFAFVEQLAADLKAAGLVKNPPFALNANAKI